MLELGRPVEHGPLDTHIRTEFRNKVGDSAWFCPFPRCDVAYFNLFDAVVMMDELKAPVYPHDLDAPICACFGLTYDDVEADVSEGTPTRVRALLAKSQSPEARCARLPPMGGVVWGRCRSCICDCGRRARSASKGFKELVLWTPLLALRAQRPR